MNNIDHIAKEFYAQYGLAMHTAQILESGLLELYAIHKYVIDNISNEEYFRILGNPKKWTLGKIINIVDEENLIDKSKVSNFKIANKNRIFLAHNFWWENEIEFDESPKLVQLHNKIFNYIKIFNELLAYINTRILSVREKHRSKIEGNSGLDFNTRLNHIKNLKKN